jgi:anthranilate phosphoribosyltransferase
LYLPALMREKAMNASASYSGPSVAPTTLEPVPANEAAVRLKAMLGGIFSGRDLTRVEAFELLGYVLDGQATDAQIAAVLVALARKGECVDELVGLTEAMRHRMVALRTRHRCFVDTCGTGASPAKTFNISTAAAFVAAAAGVPVAKHGARASTSKSGSADVLAAMGAPVPVPPAVSEQLFDSLGFCFLFAPAHHPASARVAGIRRELGVRTCFNLIGPLCNPAGSRRQVMGISDISLMPKIASALAALGAERAWVVHGSDGLDEVTLSGPTRVLELRDGRQQARSVTPEDFGYRPEALKPARAQDAAASARIIREVLEEGRRDVARRLITANAAAALYVGGVSESLRECAGQAEEAIDSGAAAEKLHAFLRGAQAATGGEKA